MDATAAGSLNYRKTRLTWTAHSRDGPPSLKVPPMVRAASLSHSSSPAFPQLSFAVFCFTSKLVISRFVISPQPFRLLLNILEHAFVPEEFIFLGPTFMFLVEIKIGEAFREISIVSQLSEINLKDK